MVFNPFCHYEWWRRLVSFDVCRVATEKQIEKRIGECHARLVSHCTAVLDARHECPLCAHAWASAVGNLQFWSCTKLHDLSWRNWSYGLLRTMAIELTSLSTSLSTCISGALWQFFQCRISVPHCLTSESTYVTTASVFRCLFSLAVLSKLSLRATQFKAFSSPWTFWQGSHVQNPLRFRNTTVYPSPVSPGPYFSLPYSFMVRFRSISDTKTIVVKARIWSSQLNDMQLVSLPSLPPLIKRGSSSSRYCPRSIVFFFFLFSMSVVGGRRLKRHDLWAARIVTGHCVWLAWWTIS